MSKTSIEEKTKLLHNLLSQIDESYELINQYDQIPLTYGDKKFYQAETHTIQLIGKMPGITVSEIAEKTGKTKSACSQIIKKLCLSGTVVQIRNPQNNRQYYLELTDYGWQVYNEHEALDSYCYDNYTKQMEYISIEQLKAAILVQEKLNEVFRHDVDRSLKQSNGKKHSFVQDEPVSRRVL